MPRFLEANIGKQQKYEKRILTRANNTVNDFFCLDRYYKHDMPWQKLRHLPTAEVNFERCLYKIIYSNMK